jgi:hypothetical protein
MTTTMSELKRKSASRSDRERASQRVDFNFLVDAEALLAARLERVSLDDISR